MEGMRPHNRRSLDRHEFKEEIRMVFRTPVRSYSVRAIDANCFGLKLEVPTQPYQKLTDRELEECFVEVPGMKPIPVLVPYRVNLANREHLGVTYQRTLPPSPYDISFRGDENEWDLVEDEKEITALMDDLIRFGPQSLVQMKQAGREGQGYILHRTPAGDLVIERHERDRRQIKWSDAQVILTFNLYQCAYVGHGLIKKVADRRLVIAPPSRFARLLRRETFRTPVDPQKSFFARFHNVFGHDMSNSFPIIDVSEHGVLLLDAHNTALAPMGSALADFSLHCGDTTINARATLASVRRSNRGLLLGVSLNIDEHSARRDWHDVILALRYTTLDFKYHEPDHQRIWSLFDRSGYTTHLKDQTEINHLQSNRQHSLVTWKKLDEAGLEVSRRLLFRNGENVVGHLQMDRYYNDTWCVHHLAIDKTVSKLVARELYGAVTDILSTEDAEYLISYHRPDLAWNQRNYYEFIERYRYPDHHDVRLFHLYDANLLRITPTADSSQFTLCQANQWDLRRIERAYSLTNSPLACKALNVTSGGMKLEHLNRRLKPFGLERGREFIIAKKDQTLLGFARIEWGSPGANVFQLFDTVFLTVVDPTVTHEIIPQLLSAAGLELRKRGKTRGLYFLEDGQIPKEVPTYLSYLCDEVRWIANCAATRRYQAYSQTLFGRLLARRTSRRQRETI